MKWEKDYSHHTRQPCNTSVNPTYKRNFMVTE